MPISGNSYYNDHQTNGEKKKPFFKAYLDALKAGKQALDAAASDAVPPMTAPAPTPQAAPAPVVMERALSPEPDAVATPAPASAAVRQTRRPAKRRRSTGSDSTELTISPSPPMDAMMAQILQLAQKVEAAASKVEAVADKAEASSRPSADDGAMIPSRQPSLHTGAASAVELPSVPSVVSHPDVNASVSMPVGQPAWRGASESVAREPASGLVTLEHDMSIPKVAPFILEEASEPVITASIPELRTVDGGAPELLLTKTQDEPRAPGKPIVLRSQQPHGRAANNGR